MEKINMAVSEAKLNKDRHIREFDMINGTDFADWIYRWDLYKEGDGHGYEPSYPIDEIMSNLIIHSTDRIIDIGCGKGYAMHLLHKYPFEQIDGIELHPKLASIAKSNMEILYHDSKHIVYEGNASEFDKYDQYNYYFLYNPFGERTLNVVLDKILKMSKSKKITIIAPECEFNNVYIEKGFYLEYSIKNGCVFTYQII